MKLGENEIDFSINARISSRKHLRGGQTFAETTIIICMLSLVVFWCGRGLNATFSEPLRKLAPSAEVAEDSTTVVDDYSPGYRPQSWTVALVMALSVGLAIGYISLRRRASSKRSPDETPDQLEQPMLVQRFAEPNALFEKREALFHRLIERCSQDSCATVEDIMTDNPFSVSLTTTSGKIERMMNSHQFQHLMVCDDSGKLVGVVSDRDLKTEELQAAAIMTPSPIVVAPNTNISDAVSLMLKNRISCLPVLSDDQLVGVVSLSDVAISLQCMLAIFGDLVALLKYNEYVQLKEPIESPMSGNATSDFD